MQTYRQVNSGTFSGTAAPSRERGPTQGALVTNRVAPYQTRQVPLLPRPSAAAPKLEDEIQALYHAVLVDKICIGVRASLPGTGFILAHIESVDSIFVNTRKRLRAVIERCRLLYSDADSAQHRGLEAALTWLESREFRFVVSEAAQQGVRVFNAAVNSTLEARQEEAAVFLNHALCVFRAAYECCELAKPAILLLDKLVWYSLRPSVVVSTP